MRWAIGRFPGPSGIPSVGNVAVAPLGRGHVDLNDDIRRGGRTRRRRRLAVGVTPRAERDHTPLGKRSRLLGLASQGRNHDVPWRSFRGRPVASRRVLHPGPAASGAGAERPHQERHSSERAHGGSSAMLHDSQRATVESAWPLATPAAHSSQPRPSPPPFHAVVSLQRRDCDRRPPSRTGSPPACKGKRARTSAQTGRPRSCGPSESS